MGWRGRPGGEPGQIRQGMLRMNGRRASPTGTECARKAGPGRGYQSGSDSYQTALGMDADGNWVNISGSGSSTQAGGNGCSYSGAGSLSASGNPWFHSTASEHGNQSSQQGQTQAWYISGGRRRPRAARRPAGIGPKAGPPRAGRTTTASRITTSPPAAARHPAAPAAAR